MAIRIDNALLVLDDDINTAIHLKDYGFEAETIIEYIEEHPFPEDPEYLEKDFYSDTVFASPGVYVLPQKTGKEVRDYIIKFLKATMC